MEDIKVLIDEEKLLNRIKILGEQITKDYKKSKELIVVCILKGSLYFTADLTKHIKNNNLKIDFMKVSSYGDEFISSGKVKIIKDLDTDIKNKDVLIIEDIIDTGNTLYYLKNELNTRNPKSLKICTLLDKKSRRQKDITPDYIGFEIEDKFVIGYGLDYKDLCRNIPYVGYIE
ncbi:MAG: hypoxanthine phosphoribosyltransferase [Clostridia bacterium]|nr:hypoxanthine phosphoribosyltransferase [Clostridia bacterium]